MRARVRVGVLQVDTHHARACGADEGVEVEDDVLVAAAVAVKAAAVLWLPLVILEDLVVPVRSGSGSGPEMELAFWCLMAVRRSGAGGVGGGCAVESGLVFVLGGSGCRWAEGGLGGGLLARSYFSSSFLFDILGAGASEPGADTICVRIA